jgi:hypothetical protein
MTGVLLSFDPSTHDFGWARCKFDQRSDIYDFELWRSGVIHPQGVDIQTKWEDAYRQLVAELGLSDCPTDIVAEQPCWMPSAKGRTAAALDYTIHLAQMVAGVIAWFRLPASHITLLTPGQWKGNVPKKVTRARLEKAFSDADFSEAGDDEVDAIGLGVYWLENRLRTLNGPPLDERHAAAQADLVQLVSQARASCNGNDSAWWGRISTILRRRGDIPRGLARAVLRKEFKIRPRQIETIMNNA